MGDETIETLLETLGFQEDIETLRKADIDLEVLQYVSENDLKEIGLSMGKRKKIMKKIESMTIKTFIMGDETIETLLETLGFQEDIETFRKADIDLEVLQSMGENDLKEIGLSMGKRKKILKKIESMTIKRSAYAPADKSAEGAEGHSLVEVCQKQNLKAKEVLMEADHTHPNPMKEMPVREQVMGNYTNCVGDWMNEEIRIVLIGKTGSGKSASGNTILGGKMFVSSISGSSITRKCSKKQAIRFDRKILIVDTPGIFDTQHSLEKIQNEIIKCISITSPGPHAFILVLSLTRYTKEEHKSVMHFVKHFGEDIYKYFIVLFTRKDDLDEEGRTLLEHIETVPPELKLFIKKCGGRVIAFNNRLKGEEMDAQVVELLSMILENIENNEGKWYTDEMYEQAEKLIKEKEAEDLKRAKEERDKEMQTIEKKLAEKYEAIFAMEGEKFRKAQSELDAMIRKQKEEESQSYLLKKEVKKLEKQLAESKEEEKEKTRQTLEFTKNEEARTKAAAERNNRKIEKLRKSKEKEESRLEEIRREQDEERRRMEDEAEKKFIKETEKVRDTIREEAEQGKGIVTRVKDFIVGGLKKLNPFNWV